MDWAFCINVFSVHIPSHTCMSTRAHRHTHIYTLIVMKGKEVIISTGDGWGTCIRSTGERKRWRNKIMQSCFNFKNLNN